MASRRMFSLDVVDTDKFLEMPATSQNLYFHLGMRADDDGFVSSPRKITKLVNCGNDDLEVLLSRGYLIAFDDGVIVIRHWKQNNFVRSDRRKDTIYQREMTSLLAKNGVYELANSIMDNKQELDGIPNDNQMVTKRDTQVRLDKYNKDICSPKDERESDFEKIYAIYPKKRGRTKAFDNYCFWLKGKEVNRKKVRLDNRQMYLTVRNYVEQQERDGTALEYYKNFDTLMGKQLLDYVEVEPDE